MVRYLLFREFMQIRTIAKYSFIIHNTGPDTPLYIEFFFYVSVYCNPCTA